jgi:hypothetical protein
MLLAGVTNLDWQIVGIGDFNHDGRADILWRNIRTGADAIWQSGNVGTPRTMAGVTNPNWRIVGVGDFDGDGTSDVLWRNVATGANVIWRSANLATPMPVAAVAQTDWQVVAIGDYDGSGTSDIFWRNATTGANVVWRSANVADSMAVAAVPSTAWKVVPYFAQALGGAVPEPATISVAGTSTSEGNSGTQTATFKVTLSRALATPVTYDISTVDGTAVSGSDYQAKAMVGAVIPAGQTSADFDVAIVGDTVVESNETFYVHITRAVGAVIGNATAAGTIVDDDYHYPY